MQRNMIKAVTGLACVTVAAVLGFGLLAAVRGEQDDVPLQTAKVQRGDLTLTVTEGGSLEAMESLEVKNDAEGNPQTEYMRAIADVVEEGIVVTEQDVAEGKVLVRFDSADLEEREAQRRIWLAGREANYARAREDYDIQKKQNDSDVAAAKLNVRFARLELDRYVGAGRAAQVVRDGSGFADLADDPTLGGAAREDIRRSTERVGIARSGLSQAEQKLRSAQSLQAENYITGTELTAARLAASRARRELEAAEEELRLLRRYVLPKEARRRYSNYVESTRELERAEARARSRIAQAEADLKSAQASYELDRQRLELDRHNIEYCTIRATQPGPVVYASRGEPWREPIQVGARLWQRQRVLLIPDMDTLAARVNLHETDIGKLKLGQPARVFIEALPGVEFRGNVAEIGAAASLAEAYTMPDLRVYEVDVALEGSHEGLTPGMSATAEIVVGRLRDVLYVPVEALSGLEGLWFCSIPGADGPELRRIEIGHMTEGFVEVRKGLTEGQTVYLGRELDLAGIQPSANGTEPVPVAPVERGDFAVSVTQRGAVYSTEPLELKSEVEGWNALLEVVEEGTTITQEDVESGMVLAKLNSAQLEEREGDQQVRVYDAEAKHVQARENYGIQKGQNESDIALAELNAEFARLELEHYLGADLAPLALEGQLDLAVLADDPRLGGSARQELRSYESGVERAAEELLRAQDRLTWSEKLCAKEFASRKELMTDKLTAARRAAELETAREELRLFKRYVLRRDVEQLCSDSVELARELDRVKARAASRLAQAEGRLRSAEAALKLERERLTKVREQIAKCTIRAPRPGQAIYGSRSDPVWYRTGDMALRPGANIEENRTIIRIPDPSSLAAIVNVPEAEIGKVEVGQPAAIHLVAVPDKTFVGRVARVSPVASTDASYIESDARAYETEVALEEEPDLFIPGMTAYVEIFAAQLEDVLYVPAQAINQHMGHSVCWVKGPDGPEPRRVETGQRSHVHVQIKTGLEPGEVVYLAPPQEMTDEMLKQIGVVSGRPQEPEVEQPAAPDMAEELDLSDLP